MLWNSFVKISSFISNSVGGNSSADRDSDDCEETMDDGCNNFNGLCLKGIMMPVEVLCSILKWVDEDSLVHKCRLVCKQWKDVVDDLVWEEKTGCSKKFLGPRSTVQIPWWVAYWISKHPNGLFNHNILKNNCGQDQFNHWSILENGGDSWTVENEPVGTMDPLPSCSEIGTRKSCFVSSFAWCGKQQICKLSAVGLSHKIMDEIQPDFEISEWIATRFDCGGMYILCVYLLDSKRKVLGELVSESRHLNYGEGWEKVSTVLKSPYPPGARYICFYHKAKDNQFWKGHYGVKMTGASLYPIFPKERFLANSASPSTPTELTASLDCQESTFLPSVSN